MSEHHRGAWGAHGPGAGGREDAVWWQDQQQAAGLASLQHQLAQQHQQQLAAQLQHQQQEQQQLLQQQQQQLFNYKMASSFPNATSATAVSSSSYDLGTVNTVNTSVAGQLPQQALQQVQQVQQGQVVQQNSQWWYSGGIPTQMPNSAQGVNVNLNAQQLMNRQGGRMPRKDAKPRGRMTAYAFFVQTCREEHKKQHPEENVVFAEFSKKCAERWKTMHDKEKRRFHEMAEKDKKRYDTEMQDYVPPVGDKRGKKRKQIKDPNAPKRSLSAFFWFCNDERGKVKAANPEMTVGEIAKELGRRWSDISPELKSKYEQMAEKDKARYERDMTAYKKKPKGGMPMPAMGGQPKAESDDDDDDDDDDGDDDE
ncbi:hypothetical protein ONE63_008988 [Megalurothrips usitatus]|uniref:HMG box domain-containing protein n=1 Tax=Megalurothrips usitatus TaxID=439358 RepID=A0AAV7XMB6_9NEOP|nr:hypothetical protein ONE63_008988 [Megalurothrips usitatus]